MVLNMHIKDEISPTLRVIVNQFDENNRRPSDFQYYGQKSAEEFDATIDHEVVDEGEEYDNCPIWTYEHDNQTFAADVGSNDVDSNYPQVLHCFSVVELHACLQRCFLLLLLLLSD